MPEIKNFFNWLVSPDVLAVLDIIGVCVTVATFIGMLRIKRRIKIELDREQFRKKCSRLCKEISGYHDNIQDGHYSAEGFRKIDGLLDETLALYSCLPFRLKARIKYVSYILQHKCIPHAEDTELSTAHKLCKQLRRIEVGLRKEG